MKHDIINITDYFFARCGGRGNNVMKRHAWLYICLPICLRVSMFISVQNAYHQFVTLHYITLHCTKISGEFKFDHLTETE
jgi:hypothetical protein